MLAQTPGAVRDPVGFLTGSVERHGPVVALPAGPGVLHVARPDLVHEFLVRSAGDYSKRTPQYDALARVTGEGILVSDDPPWRSHRRVVQPAFHRSVLTAVVGHAAASAEALAAAWQRRSVGGPVDVAGGVTAATTRMVRDCFFGDGPAASVDGMCRAALAASAGIVDRAVLPVSPPAWLPTPSRARSRRLLLDLERAVAAVVSDRLANGLGADALGLLLAAAREGVVAPEAVAEEAVTLVLAGQETAGSAVTWACLLLAEHPSWQDRVRDEADAAWGRGEEVLDGPPDLPVARAVLDEVLRLYPPAWVISRRAIRDTSLGDIDIPRGVFVITSPAVVHRQAAVWERAEEFDPARWLRTLRPEPGSYLPFGLGSRMCVGRDLALVEGTVMLSALLRRVAIAPAGELPPSTAKVTLRPAAATHRVVHRVTD